MKVTFDKSTNNNSLGAVKVIKDTLDLDLKEAKIAWDDGFITLEKQEDVEKLLNALKGHCECTVDTFVVKSNRFDIRIMAPWPADLTKLYMFIKGFGYDVCLPNILELLLKDANRGTIERLQDMGVRYEVLENDKTSMAEPLIEEHISDHVFPTEVASDDHLDVIIHPSYPKTHVTPRGGEFWGILSKYGVTEKNRNVVQPIIIKNMSKEDYRSIRVLDLHISEYIPVEEVVADTVNAIIRYPFPTDITAQGKRFWELMEMYSPYIKNREAPQMPIVIFNMMRTHYEELRKTSALISVYSPVGDGCVVPEAAKAEKVYNLILSSPWPEGSRVSKTPEPVEEVQPLVLCDKCKMQLDSSLNRDRIAYSEPADALPSKGLYTIGKFQIEITKHGDIVKTQDLHEVLVILGCSTKNASSLVMLLTGDLNSWLEYGVTLNIDFATLPSVFKNKSKYCIEL